MNELNEIELAIYNLIMSFKYGLISAKEYWERYTDLKRKKEELEKIK